MTKAQERRREEIVSKYGSDEKFFFETFNPSLQSVCSEHLDKVFFGTSPTLREVDWVFGQGSGARWLIPQLFDLSMFCGCREKLTSEQYAETARMIATEYGGLKVSELMLFFWHMKQGRYGEFYGKVDPQKILLGLKHFMRVRADMWAERERTQRVEQRKKTTDEESISKEEYERLKVYLTRVLEMTNEQLYEVSRARFDELYREFVVWRKCHGEELVQMLKAHEQELQKEKDRK